NVIRFTFFSAPGVKTAADLKGGVIGVSTFGSESDSTVTLALARLALARNDVVLKEYGGGTGRPGAGQAGEIKAPPLNEPLASLAREQGVNVLVGLVPEQIPWVFSSIVVRRGDIADRRHVLTRFLKGTIEGNYLALSDATRAKDVLAKELKITDPKILDVTYNDFKAQSPANIEISHHGAANILAQFPGGSQKVEDYVDASLLAALEREGYFTDHAAEVPALAAGPPMNAATRVVIALLFAAAAWPARTAAQTVEEFYRNKSITMLVGGGAGGGYDTYARVFARHLSRHIPGNPNIIAKNMPAAAGLAAASTLYGAPDKDGSALAAFTNGAAMDPLFGNTSARYDAQKFSWLGSIGKLQNVCATWHRSEVKTIAAARAREVIVAAAGATSNTAVVPKTLNALIGTKFKVIAGYDTGAGLTLAV